MNRYTVKTRLLVTYEIPIAADTPEHAQKFADHLDPDRILECGHAIVYQGPRDTTVSAGTDYKHPFYVNEDGDLA